MTNEEFKQIKAEYQRIKDLLQEQKDLNETLKTKKDLLKNRIWKNLKLLPILTGLKKKKQ